MQRPGLAPACPGPSVLTDSHQRGQDGNQERGEEHVDVAVEERHLPRARVPQAQHVGVAVVHFDVPVPGVLCREGRTHLADGPGSTSAQSGKEGPLGAARTPPVHGLTA